MIERNYSNRDPGDEQPELLGQDIYSDRCARSTQKPLLNPNVYEAAKSLGGEPVIQHVHNEFTIEIPISLDLLDEPAWISEALIYQLDLGLRRESAGLVFTLKYQPLALCWIDAAPPPGIDHDYPEPDELKFISRVNAFCQLYCLDYLRLSSRLESGSGEDL